MSTNTILLALILGVLLFGSSAVTGAISFGAWTFFTVVIIGLVILGISWVLMKGMDGLAWLFDRKWLYWFADIFVADPETPEVTKGQLMAERFVMFWGTAAMFGAFVVGLTWFKTGKWPL